MKKIKKTAVFALLLLIFSGISVAQTASKPKIEISQKSFDFGVIKEGSKPVSHEFEFVNNGQSNLVILSATAECGCTKPDYPKAPIPPGKKGRIKVTFNPAGFRGAFEKVVTVRTNGDPKKLKLKIKGAIRE